MSKLSELNTKLTAIGTQLTGVADQLAKAKDEIIAALGDVEIPADAQASLDKLSALADGLKTVSQSLDELNPDAAPPTT